MMTRLPSPITLPPPPLIRMSPTPIMSIVPTILSTRRRRPRRARRTPAPQPRELPLPVVAPERGDGRVAVPVPDGREVRRMPAVAPGAVRQLQMLPGGRGVRRGWGRERRGRLRLLRLRGRRGAALEGRRRERTAFVRELFGARTRVRAFEETAFVAELGEESGETDSEHTICEFDEGVYPYHLARAQITPPPRTRIRRATIKAPPPHPIAQLQSLPKSTSIPSSHPKTDKAPTLVAASSV
jgi:hypothetical protein